MKYEDKCLGSKQPRDRCEKTGKVKFDKKNAQTAKNKRYNEDHVGLRIYPCPFCDGWHLTSQEKLKKKDYQW